MLQPKPKQLPQDKSNVQQWYSELGTNEICYHNTNIYLGFLDTFPDTRRAKRAFQDNYYCFPTFYSTHVGQIHSFNLYTVALETPSVSTIPASTKCFRRRSAVLSIKLNFLAN